MPWLAVLPLLLPAALLVAAALLTLHGARRLLRAYGIFLFFWLGAGFLLGLLDEAWLPLLCRTLKLALRLGTMAALALALPLGATPVELGRALMDRPSLLLLDEPASGLDHADIERFAAVVEGVRDDDGTSVLLVEHDVAFVLSHCDRVVALHLGQVLAQGSPDDIRHDPAVREAYLGTHTV